MLLNCKGAEMKVSVITVCFNSSKYIRQTIESVLSQAFPDLEYVIVDGGSTDGTVDLIREYATKDPRIIWCSEPDEGISNAMNKGVTMTSGDVIAHLNSDDYYSHPDVLSRVNDAFAARPEATWLTAGFNFITENGDFLREVRVRRYSFRKLLRGNTILHPATFIKRDAFYAAGAIDESLNYCMDYDLFLRLGSRGAPLLLDEQLACFRVHDGSRSVSQSQQAYAEEFHVRMNYLDKIGKSAWFYILDYQLKRRLNRLFYRGLLASNRKKQ
jgi:glycosyltransferase involved in cell wall biosynthesis